MATATAPGLPEIERARERLSRLAGRPVRLKAENLQRTGSFKIRGAYTKLSNLEPEELAAGVVAASAGNHGQAVAWAARELGAPARIFMPHYSPMAKFEATRSYGAEVEMSGAVWEETLEAAVAYVEQTGATLVHPYEDTFVIAGQGSIGLEIAEQVDELETVVLPIGGGGLASGISLALRAVRPGLRIVGVRAADVDALQRYWTVCPQLRQALFKPNRPGYLDLAVNKDFPTGRTTKAALRLEVINVFNTPWYTRLASSNFGNANFAQVTTQANYSRFAQITVRFNW